MNSVLFPVLCRKAVQPIRSQDRQSCTFAVCVLLAAISCLIPPRAFAAVSITISPSSVNLATSGTQQFAATVTGASDVTVTWTVLEGSAGGTVSGTGLYTAPGAVGVYHVVATSNADNTQSATATVAVPGFVQTGLYNTRSGHTATLLPNGTILYAGGAIVPGVTASVSAEIYDPATQISAPTGNLTVARGAHTATLLPNGKVLLAGGQSSSGQTATADLYDPLSGTFTATGSMTVARSGHTATLLPNGKVLIAGGGNCNSGCVYYSTAELYDPSSGTFSPTGSMASAYLGGAAILLANGKVLIAGGSPDGLTSNVFAELYDPATGLFTQSGAMINPRQSFSATLLTNGKVLFAGGLVNGAVTSTAEIYDPSAGTFASTGSLNVPRDIHAATLLQKGKVLIAGGNSIVSFAVGAELYDPVAGTFTLTGNLEEPRWEPSATLLGNGKVLIAGGDGVAVLGSIETYDPSTGIFSSNSVFLNASRTGHTTTRLADGRILLIGGEDINQNPLSSAEIYDPATGKFTLTGSMAQGRTWHTATLLSDGKVLVVGGYSVFPFAASKIVPTAEFYDPSTGEFGPAGSPNVARASHTATLLQNGQVFIAGGQISTSVTTSSVELYDPVAGTFTAAGNMLAPRYNHTATLLNDGRVLIAEGLSGPLPVPPGTAARDELYDPSSGSFTPLGPQNTSSPGAILAPFDSVVLANGQVLVDYGTIFDPTTDTLSSFTIGTSTNYKFTLLPTTQVFYVGGVANIFDPNSKSYTSAGNLEYPRMSPTSTLLPNGEILIAGGSGVKQAEFYVAPVATAAPTVTNISPNPVTGFTAVPITVQGANFATGSVVMDFFVPLQTTFVSSTQLTAVFPAQNLLNAGNHPMEVANLDDPRIATFTLLVVNPQLQSTVPQGGSLNFANVNVGSFAGLSASFTDVGNQALKIDSFSISGTDSTDFTFDPATTCPAQGLTLAPQAACAVTIKFTPSGVGTFNATLTVNYEIPGSPMVIPLTGIGVGVPGLTIAPPSLTFGNQAIGTSSAPQSFTITNSGTGTLQISSVAVNDTADFGQTNNCSGSIAPGANCLVNVTFAPSSAGTIASSVSVVANDGLPHSVQVSGVAFGVPAAAIAPLSLTFASQTIGTSSAAQGVIVASTGTASLTISSIALSDTADFQMTSNCPASLAPNTNCSFGVTFAPSTVGNISGTAVVTAGDGGSPHTIQLSGTATGFSLAPVTGASTTATVAAGQPATYQLDLAAQAFSGSVALTCAPVTAIPNATCSVSPNPVTLSGTAAAPVTVSVTTTARSAISFPLRTRPFVDLRAHPFVSTRLFFLLSILFGLVAASGKVWPRISLKLTMALLLVLLATGCAGGGSGGTQGGGSGGTPAGTYQLIVTASSSGVTRNITLTLTVQ